MAIFHWPRTTAAGSLCDVRLERIMLWFWTWVACPTLSSWDTSLRVCGC